MQARAGNRWPIARDQSVTIFLSIYLLLLVFFVMLTAVSGLEQKESHSQASALSGAPRAKMELIRDQLLTLLSIDLPDSNPQHEDYVFFIPIIFLFPANDINISLSGVTLLRGLVAQAQAPIGIDILLPLEQSGNLNSTISQDRAIATGAAASLVQVSGRVRVGLSKNPPDQVLIRYVLISPSLPLAR